MTIQTMTLGYARMGKRRELKKTFENSRSDNETLFEITDAGYRYQVGNRVYDVHSPAVPSAEQMLQQLRTGVDHLPIAQTWINPDCGLKTCRWEEVVPALKNMVAATQQLREEIQNAAN